MKHLTEMVRQHKAGKTNGIYAVCSAHPLVLEAAIRYASANQTPLLIEATSIRWTSSAVIPEMTPADFRGFVCQLADSLNFPQDALILVVTIWGQTAGKTCLPLRQWPMPMI